jgi:hypothetical protein
LSGDEDFIARLTPFARRPLFFARTFAALHRRQSTQTTNFIFVLTMFLPRS